MAHVQCLVMRALHLISSQPWASKQGASSSQNDSGSPLDLRRDDADAQCLTVSIVCFKVSSTLRLLLACLFMSGARTCAGSFDENTLREAAAVGVEAAAVVWAGPAFGQKAHSCRDCVNMQDSARSTCYVASTCGERALTGA